MGKQSFDHSAFIAGTLNKYEKVGWAEQVVLGEGARSIWLMQAKHIDHNSGQRGFELQIQKYVKGSNAAVFGEPEKSFVLQESAISKLFDYLQRQQALGKINLGSGYLAIPLNTAQLGLSTNQITALSTVFRDLIESNKFPELLASGCFTKEVLENLSAASQHLRYKTAVAELRELLKTVKDEKIYQKWFENHPWICGTNYVGKVDLRRIGLHEITDIVMQTTDGYLDLIELKRPDFPVLQQDASRKNYYFSTEVSKAIAQAAGYITTTEQNRHMLAQEENLFFLKPRARIVIGRTLNWEQKTNDALRILNGSLHFIEVWTYDHLLAIADQMVKLYEAAEEPPTNDDVPF